MTDGTSTTPNEGELTTVFFSYSRADQARALEIIGFLESAGYRVWWDGVLEAGVRYIETTEEALESANAVIVLWTDNSVASHWVRDEAMFGRDSARLVPLSLDGVEPPLGFRQFQVIDMSGWNEGSDRRQADGMLRAVADLHENPPEPRPMPELPARREMSRRNLFIGVGAAGLAVAGGGLLWQLTRGATPLTGNGIAVLPFDNISGDVALDYMAMGLATDLRASLARNPALLVVARSTCAAMKSRGLDAVAIARELGVGFVLEGAVGANESSVQVSTELIDGASGFGVWTETYRSTEADLLKVKQATISAVTRQMAPLSPVVETLSGDTNNPAAFDQYLLGVELYRTSTSEEQDMRTLEHFNRAIALDPGFARAHAAKARTLTVLGNLAAEGPQRKVYYANAVEAARTAVEAAPDLADAHSTLGLVLFDGQLKVRDARDHYYRSRELGAGEATVLVRFAEYAALTGNTDAAMASVEKALSIDPLNSGTTFAKAQIQYFADQYEAAIETARKSLTLADQVRGASALIGLSYLKLGNLDAGHTACGNEVLPLLGLSCDAILSNAMGDQPRADEAFDNLVNSYGDGGAYQQAQVKAFWGDLEGAMALLDRAFKVGDAGLTYLFVDPLLNPLRDRPDFLRLQTELGFG